MMTTMTMTIPFYVSIIITISVIVCSQERFVSIIPLAFIIMIVVVVVVVAMSMPTTMMTSMRH